MLPPHQPSHAMSKKTLNARSRSPISSPLPPPLLSQVPTHSPPACLPPPLPSQPTRHRRALARQSSTTSSAVGGLRCHEPPDDESSEGGGPPLPIPGGRRQRGAEADGRAGRHRATPFLTKTYDMVDDPALDVVVHGAPPTKAHLDPYLFGTVLLPRYFKHNNFLSIVRQLDTYMDFGVGGATMALASVSSSGGGSDLSVMVIGSDFAVDAGAALLVSPADREEWHDYIPDLCDDFSNLEERQVIHVQGADRSSRAVIGKLDNQNCCAYKFRDID